MCVAIPARIIAVGARDGMSLPATVSVAGRERAVDLGLVPEATVGDYVVTHAGFAISVVPRARALETIEMLGLDPD